MKKLLTTAAILVLLCAMLASAAFADAGLDNFRAQTAYSGQFKDVAKSDWFYESVAGATEYGLIRGATDTTFNPEGTLTWAEGIALAARLHSIYHTGSENFKQGSPWYKVYTDYAVKKGMLPYRPANYGAGIPRGDFAKLLVSGFPAEALAPINDIPEGSIPDLLPASDWHDAVYTLYRAGVLTGNDETGVSVAKRTLKRSEAAAILIRMANPDARRSFSLGITLTVYKPDGSTKTIPALELLKMEALGWYRQPVTTLYNGAGAQVVRLDQVEGYLKKGWSREPVRVIPAAMRAQVSTSIPVISVDTGGKEVLSKETYVTCKVNTYNTVKDLTVTDITGGIRLRGNSTSFYGDVEKIRANSVPYRLKFDSKVNLLGLNDGAKCKSWVLLTNETATMDGMRNDIAFRMGRSILEPDGYYCSDGQYVSLFLNGKYMGVYLLAEQNQVNKYRVNVAEPEDGNTSTKVGYLVEMDNYPEEPCFKLDYDKVTLTDVLGTKRAARANSYTIKSEVFSQAQVDFIAKYIRGVYTILYQACEKGNYLTFDKNYDLVKGDFASAEECFSAVADVRSMADMYILYELACDCDVGEGSFYMCVDFSEGSQYPKLTFNAPWDFNWAYGSSTDKVFAGAFRSDSFVKESGDRSSVWFITLYRQDWFRALVKARWAELGGSACIQPLIDEERALLALYGTDMNRRSSSVVSRFGETLQWLEKRAAWLDTQWN